MATPFQTEAWTLYGVGMVILIFRVIVRTRQIGFHWEGDDYFTILAIIFFTVELCMLELIGQNGTIVGMTDEVALTLTQGEKDKLVLGSKLLLVGWITYTTLIWCLKGCLLFFYNRLTLNLAQHRLVKVTSVTCIVAYIATITVYLTHCHPLPRLWQVYPYPGDDCALGTSNYYSLVVTNIVTDLMVLYIPLPLLWKVQLPLSKKIKFGVWLCGGIFIIVATLLRCIFALKDSNSINISTIWSIRETFVGIICVNLPVLKPFFNGVKNAISSATRSSHNESSHPLSTVNNTKKGGLGIKKTVHTFTEIDDSESVKDLAKGIDPEWGMARAESRTSSGDEFEAGKKTPPRR